MRKTAEKTPDFPVFDIELDDFYRYAVQEFYAHRLKIVGTTLKNTPPDKHDCTLKKVVLSGTGTVDKKDGKENMDVKAAASSEGADELESDTLDIRDPLKPVTAER
ncbi:hypothetical protein CYMTET_4660 [Cymbomonas tetramitiformis]|uniref:Uncharacterized protein n=1 Tax=Cymbomonas tetramitiformis TaxID=36881 RepID=A0AAE0H0Z1_9CHLO|nr:hypothetical protein CYMTET_4660 [Cymbomonas tetramitiformis]